MDADAPVLCNSYIREAIFCLLLWTTSAFVFEAGFIAFHVKVSTKQSSLQKYGLFIPTDRHFEQIERGEEILISKL